MQLKSWFEIEGSSRNPITRKGVIAQFYFPTNSSDLDPEDRRILSQCADHLRRVLKRERLELAIIGHADHQGDTNYNKALGSRRAESVASEFNRQLRSEQNFSSFSGLSEGEKFSVQGAKDQQAMAHDRRVDVWSTTAEGYTIPALPKLDIKPMLMRPVSRVFREVQVDSHVSPGLDPTTEMVDFWANFLVDLIKGGQKVVPGIELVRDRIYKNTDATYKAISIDIHTLFRIEQSMAATAMEWLTTVSYHWGVAHPIVIVNLKQDDEICGKSKIGTRSTLYLSRKKADRDPFYFPPPLSSISN